MLVLYTKNNCKYCDKVKSALLEKSAVYEERNIENDEFLAEAQAKGFRTMPVLVDTIANLTIAESEEIVNYISECAF